VGRTLANLTGLGLGYGYLRRLGRALGAAAGTIALVALAFVTDASSAPWLWRGIAVVLLGAQAVDGAWLALRGPRPA
jgi:hypothetical protein